MGKACACAGRVRLTARVKGWLITGVVYQRAKARHIRGLTRIPAGLRLNRDDAHALAAELMVTSVEAFRANVLARNRWDAGRGATLKTFFVGQCLFQLPDVYQRWRKDEAMQPDSDPRIARELEERSRRLDAGAVAVDGVRRVIFSTRSTMRRRNPCSNSLPAASPMTRSLTCWRCQRRSYGRDSLEPAPPSGRRRPLSPDRESFDEKIDRSSLGEESARKLRRRTPPIVADTIVERSRDDKTTDSRGSTEPSP